jgi:hypothetical protein
MDEVSELSMAEDSARGRKGARARTRQASRGAGQRDLLSPEPSGAVQAEAGASSMASSRGMRKGGDWAGRCARGDGSRERAELGPSTRELLAAGAEQRDTRRSSTAGEWRPRHWASGRAQQLEQGGRDRADG